MTASVAQCPLWGLPVGMSALTGSVSHPSSPFMSPALPLTQLSSVCKQTLSTSLALQGKPLWQRPSSGVCSWFRRHRLLILINLIMTTISFTWYNLHIGSIQLNLLLAKTYFQSVAQWKCLHLNFSSYFSFTSYVQCSTVWWWMYCKSLWCVK